MPFGQDIVRRTLQTTLQQKLHTRVSIGRVDIGLFNRVTLTDIQLYDRQNHPLLSAGLASARIELRHLLHKEIALRTITLVDARIRLNRDAHTANYQFLIDAFRTDRPKESSTLNLRINSIILRRVAIQYDRTDRPHTPHQFNPNHFHVKRLDANVSLRRLTRDSLSLRVRHMGLDEASGIILNHLSFDAQAGKRTCIVTNLQVKLPHSHLQQDSLRFDYQGNHTGGLKAILNVTDCRIGTADLTPFIPQLRALNEALQLHFRLELSPNRAFLTHLRAMSASRNLQLSASLSFTWNDTLRNLQVSRLHLQGRPVHLAAQVAPDSVSILRILHRLGQLDLMARGNYVWGNNKPAGYLRFGLRTDVGHVTCPGLTWRNSTLATDRPISGRINAGALLPNSGLGNTEFTFGGSCFLAGRKVKKASLAATLRNLQWNQYVYRPIKVRGGYHADALRFSLQTDDPSARLRIDGQVGHLTQPQKSLDVQLNIHQLNPARLNLPGAASCFDLISGKAYAHAERIDIARPEMELCLHELTLSRNGKQPFSADSLIVRATHQLGVNHLSLQSDFLNIDLSGQFAYNHPEQLLPPYFAHHYYNLLPRALKGNAPSDTIKARQSWAEFRIQLQPTRFFEDVLNIPVLTTSGGRVYGKIDNPNDGNITLLGHMDSLSVATQQLEQLKIYGRGTGENMRLLLQATKLNQKNKLQASAEFKMEHSRVGADLRLKYGSLLNGYVSASTDLRPLIEEGTLRTKINRSYFLVEDTAWSVHPSVIELKDGKVNFDNFELSNGQQYININGALSNATTDTIKVDLRGIDINYVLDLVNFHTVKFGGRISGKAYLTQSTLAPVLEYAVNSDDFRFNDAPLGRLQATGSWSASDGRIQIHARTAIPAQNSRLGINGFVDIKQKGLDLHFNAHNTTLQFLDPYLNGIFADVNGSTSGNLRLSGPFKQLDFSGIHSVQMDATIGYTGCRYRFETDSVIFSPGKFEFRHVQLTDKRGHKATANGSIRHTHLKEFRYDVRADFSNFLAYDMPRTESMPFYASVPGSGRIRLNGEPGRFVADIDLRPEEGAEFTYILDAPATSSSDRKLLNFVDHAIKDTALTAATVPQQKSGTDIILNINVDATPQTDVKLIMDEKTGDYIMAHGSGNLRAYYYNKGNFSLFGTYTVSDGIYKMVLQNIIRKDFTFVPGGTITFTGNPRNAALNLKAQYTVNSVSLADLNPGGNFSDNNVRVDCILNLTGLASSPHVGFDLDLPTVSEDEKRMVKYLINTEEGMNMQIIYLLGIGKFYAYDGGTATGTAANQSSLAIQSFLSNTLSSHLNNVLANAIGAKNWSFGTNFSTGTYGWEDMEIEGLLNGRLLNNQLLINGNFGYRDKSTYSTSNFIGDFNVQWLLNQAGTIRLKAYSETNDRYFSKSNLTTQGIGIMLKRDFDNIKELFSRQKKH